MATTDIGENSFGSTVSENPIVLIDFWAEWCGPCKRFGPIFERVSDENPDIVFAKVDTEAEQGLMHAFGITSIPTLMAIRDGVILYSQPGALPEDALKRIVQAVRDVDMDEVRASLAANAEANSETG